MSMKIGFIGLGMMGSPMAERLVKEGYELTVHNRTKSRAESLLSRGAVWGETPRDVGAASDLVITMVSTTEVLKHVSLGPDGVLAGLRQDAVHADMSTVSPAETEGLFQEYRSRGKSFVHAPVLGSVPQVKEGTLLIFAGGERPALERCRPVFELLGKRTWEFEQVSGAGHLKLVCNLFIASMIGTLAQGLLLGKKAGVSPSIILEVIGQSALNSAMYQSKGESIQKRAFTPRFLLEHMLKDVSLMLDAGSRLSVPLPTIEPLRGLYEQAMSVGLKDEDYSAVIKVLEAQAGIEVKS